MGKEKIMSKTELFCPFCKSPVHKSGERLLGTLEEHIFDQEPSKRSFYTCSNSSCESNLPSVQIGWNEWGDLYIFGEDYKEGMRVEKTAIDKNSAPFGSHQRQSNVEIYKVGLKDHLVEVNPKWWLGNFGFFIECKYKSDLQGSVLKRSYRLQLLKKDGDVSTFYISPVRMFMYIFREFLRKRRSFLNEPNKYSVDELLKEFKIESWEKRRYKRFFNWFVNKFYAKTYRKALIFKATNV